MTSMVERLVDVYVKWFISRHEEWTRDFHSHCQSLPTSKRSFPA